MDAAGRGRRHLTNAVRGVMRPGKSERVVISQPWQRG